MFDDYLVIPGKFALADDESAFRAVLQNAGYADVDEFLEDHPEHADAVPDPEISLSAAYDLAVLIHGEEPDTVKGYDVHVVSPEGVILDEDEARDEYEEYLDENLPSIDIEGSEFSAGRILRELDPTAFRTGMANYFDAIGYFDDLDAYHESLL